MSDNERGELGPWAWACDSKPVAKLTVRSDRNAERDDADAVCRSLARMVGCHPPKLRNVRKFLPWRTTSAPGRGHGNQDLIPRQICGSKTYAT